MKRIHVFIVVSFVFLSQGCSFSKSSESSSNSISSIVSSPSNSSESSDPTAQYHDDVVDYTFAYVKSSEADVMAFKQGIAAIASEQGILNWENEPTTFIAIGEALKKANITGISYETYKTNLTDQNEIKMKYLQEGYDDN